MVELTLIVIYTCVLVIKSCHFSESLCVSFGFGGDAEGAGCLACGMWKLRDKTRSSIVLASSTGLYVFFVLFGLSMVLSQIIFATCRFYVTGRVPTLILQAQVHSMSLSQIVWRVLVRRLVCELN
eukprot:4515201-Prymnesium_polylepis.1